MSSLMSLGGPRRLGDPGRPPRVEPTGPIAPEWVEEVVPEPVEVLDDATWEANVGSWVPTPEDRAQVAELMTPHHEEGQFAGWLTPPPQGINAMPVEYDYVRF